MYSTWPYLHKRPYNLSFGTFGWLVAILELRAETLASCIAQQTSFAINEINMFIMVDILAGSYWNEMVGNER